MWTDIGQIQFNSISLYSKERRRKNFLAAFYCAWDSMHSFIQSFIHLRIHSFSFIWFICLFAYLRVRFLRFLHRYTVETESNRTEAKLYLPFIRHNFIWKLNKRSLHQLPFVTNYSAHHFSSFSSISSYSIIRLHQRQWQQQQQQQHNEPTKFVNNCDN